MNRILLIIVALVACSELSPRAMAQSMTSIRSERARTVAGLTIKGEFAAALDSCHAIVREEPANPVGYFLLATAYYTINNQFRNDHYADSVSTAVDTAIALARKRTEDSRNSAEWHFVLGSSFGCRALYRSLHGGWWGAFRDGHNGCVNLEKAYDKDTSFTDALSGVGAYHFWKSAKAKILTFLPFVSDKRDEGIAELRRAVAAHGTMSVNAQRSLLPIYYEQKQYDAAVALADSLATEHLLDPNSRLHLARSLIALKQWDQAMQALDQVLSEWKNSPYYDSCAEPEVLYLKATIYKGRGESAEAQKCLDQIFAAKAACDNNQYYQQSLSSANDLAH